MKRWAAAFSLCAGCAFTLPPPSSTDVDAGARDVVTPDVDVVFADAGATDAGAEAGAADVPGRDVALADVALDAPADVTRSDAGASDLGAVDAGASDAGAVDVAPLDVGTEDTGVADSGAAGSDAGVSDVAPADAGAVDVGVSDAPTPVTVVDVDAGDDFTCAVLSNGRLYCWGKNNERQLGVGDTTDRARPTLVASTEVFVRVSAGGQHGCAITAAGALWCWGRNNRGQLGDGTTMNRATPVRALASGVTSVSAGGEHTCAVMDARVHCWGKGDSGQIGDGLLSDQTSPTPVGAFTALEVAAGEAHSCARVTGVSGCSGDPASLLCWGKNDHLQVGAGATATYNAPTPVAPSGTSCRSVVALSAARNNTCATWSDALYCWGENADGQVGVGAASMESLPSAVAFSGASGPLTAALPSVGGMFAFALVTEAGAVRPWSWGKNMEGQLALGASGADVTSPVPATGLASLDAAQVSAGNGHACARTRAGELYCWGMGGAGRLGTGSSTNSAVPARVTF